MSVVRLIYPHVIVGDIEIVNVDASDGAEDVVISEGLTLVRKMDFSANPVIIHHQPSGGVAARATWDGPLEQYGGRWFKNGEPVPILWRGGLA